MVNTRLNFNLILKHSLGWLFFILYEVSFVWFTTEKTFPLVAYICFYFLNIVLFYTNACVVLTFAFTKRKPYWIAGSIIIIEILLYTGIKYSLDVFFNATHTVILSRDVLFKKFIILDLYRGVYFIAFSTLYWSVLRVVQLQRQASVIEKANLMMLMENAELAKNLAESRNAYLKHQINPHFLFNTLNYIYSTFYKFSENASQCVLKLSDIMRYSLHEAGDDGKVDLTGELAQIENLITINKLRFNYELYLHCEFIIQSDEPRIIPLILLTIVENIFKHGNLKEKDQPGKLSIVVDENSKLSLICWNLRKPQSVNKRLKSIGIENVFKRLNYTYQDQYELNIKEEDNSYELHLSIQL